VADGKRKNNGRRRSEAQSRALNRGAAIPSYFKEVTKEFTSKSDNKLARNQKDL
jgi:hypothetical protein